VTTVWSGTCSEAAGLQTVLIPALQAGATYSFRLRALLPHCTVVGPAVSYIKDADTTVTSADETVTTTTSAAAAATVTVADAPLQLQAAPAYFLSNAAKRSAAAGSSRRGSLCVKLTWHYASSDVSTADCMYTVQCSRTAAECTASGDAGEQWRHVYTGALPECHDAATLGAAHVRACYRVRWVTDTACAVWSEVCAVDMQLPQPQCHSLVHVDAGLIDSVFQLTALQCDGADTDVASTAEHKSPTRPTSAMSSSAALRHSHRLSNSRTAAAALALQQQHSKAHAPRCCTTTAAVSAPAKLLLALQQTLGEQWGADYAQMLCSSTANSTDSSGKCSSGSDARFDWNTVSIEMVDHQLLQAAVASKCSSGHRSTTAACALTQQQYERQPQSQQQQQRVVPKLSAQRPASAAASPATSASCAPNSKATVPQRVRQLLQQRVLLLAERVYCRQPRRAQSAGTAACRSARHPP
jgi:hypothetical protein